MRAIPALQAFIEKMVDGGFNATTTSVALAASVTRVLQGNFERMAATIINTSSVNITVAPTPLVTTTMGILLAANGGALALTARDDLALVGWDWWAIPASGTPSVITMEVVRIYIDSTTRGEA